jgi:hypothetical protein
MKDKKRTIKQIDAEIKEAKEQLSTKYWYKQDETYLKLIKELDEAKKKVREYEIEHYEEAYKNVSEVREIINELESEKQLKKLKNSIVIPPDVQDWFKQWGTGVDWGYGKPKIVWISPDYKYVIITIPGGTAGTGTAMGTGGYYYAPSSHLATETKGRHHSGYRDEVWKTSEIEGRLTNNIKQQLIDQINEHSGMDYQLKDRNHNLKSY